MNISKKDLEGIRILISQLNKRTPYGELYHFTINNETSESSYSDVSFGITYVYDTFKAVYILYDGNDNENLFKVLKFVTKKILESNLYFFDTLYKGNPGLGSYLEGRDNRDHSPEPDEKGWIDILSLCDTEDDTQVDTSTYVTDTATFIFDEMLSLDDIDEVPF